MAFLEFISVTMQAEREGKKNLFIVKVDFIEDFV